MTLVKNGMQIENIVYNLVIDKCPTNCSSCPRTFTSKWIKNQIICNCHCHNIANRCENQLKKTEFKEKSPVCLNLDVQSPIQTNYDENKMIRRRYTNDHR